MSDDLMRLWQQHEPATPNPERVARTIMAHVWTFDQKIFWRNFREYLAGAILMVIFAFQAIVGEDRIGGVVGLVCVGFVMTYLWWKHRGLHPLDPAADTATYRAALLGRYDQQLVLLRTVPYWYLVPLFLPGLWTAVWTWPQSPSAAGMSLVVLLAAFVFVGWLNVRVGVGRVRKAREQVAAMVPEER